MRLARARQYGPQMRQLLLILALLLIPTAGGAQNRSEDEYTRYELLAPETSSLFRPSATRSTKAGGSTR